VDVYVSVLNLIVFDHKNILLASNVKIVVNETYSLHNYQAKVRKVKSRK